MTTASRRPNEEPATSEFIYNVNNDIRNEGMDSVFIPDTMATCNVMSPYITHGDTNGGDERDRSKNNMEDIHRTKYYTDEQRSTTPSWPNQGRGDMGSGSNSEMTCTYTATGNAETKESFRNAEGSYRRDIERPAESRTACVEARRGLEGAQPMSPSTVGSPNVSTRLTANGVCIMPSQLARQRQHQLLHLLDDLHSVRLPATLDDRLYFRHGLYKTAINRQYNELDNIYPDEPKERIKGNIEVKVEYEHREALDTDSNECRGTLDSDINRVMGARQCSEHYSSDRAEPKSTGHTRADFKWRKLEHTAVHVQFHLLRGYCEVVRRIRRHVLGTKRHRKWISIEDARTGAEAIAWYWYRSIDLTEVSWCDESKCRHALGRWRRLDHVPSATECDDDIRRVLALKDQLWSDITVAQGRCTMSHTGVAQYDAVDIEDSTFQAMWGLSFDLFNNATKTLCDGQTAESLIQRYRGNLKLQYQGGTNVRHRRWVDSPQIRAAGASLSLISRQKWLGPTRGTTVWERAQHRLLKRRISSQMFRFTLAHDLITNRLDSEAVDVDYVDVRLPQQRTRMGGNKKDEDEEYSLFAQYVARVEQLSKEFHPGHTQYLPKQRLDFDKMSRRRQILELGKIGLSLDSLDEAHKLYVQDDDIMYPSSHTPYEVPTLIVKSMTTAEILHHRFHITAKIRRLAKLKRESKREARMALRRIRKDDQARLRGMDLSIGTQRTRNIYALHRAITGHVTLLAQLESQLKERFKTHKFAEPMYIDEEQGGTVQEPSASCTPPMRRQHRACRRHTRATTTIETDGECLVNNVEDDRPTFLQELRRHRLRKWEKRRQQTLYRTAQDRVGGYVSERAEEFDKLEGAEQQRLTVCTVNVAGFDESDNKLEMILQFCQDEQIDVMVCIDAQLDEKRGHWYGKIAKRRLGVGTRTNVNPCILDYGDGTTGSFRRVGGIFIIISPKWGTSLVGCQKDKFGPGGGSAGVMSQVTLATKDAKLNIIGAYWPNKHSPADTSDRNLWKCLNRYVYQHRRQDNSPTELMQRVSQQWIATAHSNGARGSILCGDLNATWTGAEAGGQAILHNWASAFSLHNGIQKAAQKHNVAMHTRGGEGKPKTWIDHVLHKGKPEYIDCLAGYTSQAAEWEGISDHRPIWGVYRVHAPLQKCPTSMKAQKVRYELRLTDKHKCDEFADAMEQLLALPKPTDDSSDEEVIEYMRQIERTSGKTVKRLYKRAGQFKTRSSRKDGWSPTYIAYKAQLTTLVEIRRSLLGQAGRRPWRSVTEMRDEMPERISLWEMTLDGLDLAGPQKASILGSTAHPPCWWKELEILPDAGLIDADMDCVKKLLHGTARNEMRRRINLHIRHREDLRRDGKWRNVISSLLGNLAGRKHQPGIDLNLIATDEGDVLGDPVDIHNAVTDQFEQRWFNTPEQCHGDLHQGNNWRQCMNSEGYFVQDTAHTGAPEEYRRLIHRAIVNVPQRDTMHEELRNTLKVAPTLLEFEIAIQNAKTNSSAGMSGCSYNQLKRWPPELIQNLHYCLTRLWATQATPDWWTARWLVVIPKKQEEIPNVSNMRPLILVEAIRKLWCKLLLGRILSVWQKHNALHRFQHGFIHGRSTMTASALFINMLEDSIEHGRPLHTCTWDITKAFDSVSKNVMRLAWSRLGVPDEWIRWLIEMDEKGMTVVRTPHAIKVWNARGTGGFHKRQRLRKQTGGFPQYRCPGTTAPMHSDNCDDPVVDNCTADGFIAERGTGQGDVTSPTCWAAIFDILLTALHMDIQGTHRAHVSSASNTGYAEGETAYADDLLSCARTPEALQRKADIVSTFCMIMGLQLSTTKLRRFVMAHSGIAEDDQYVTIVHKYGSRAHVDGPLWDAEHISASTDGVLEYLGGKYDTNPSKQTALQEIKDIATTHCAEIGNTAACALTKIACSNMTTYAKIRYKSKLASTTLAELCDVDKIFYKFHTKATKNMRSFPYDLLYQDPLRGGVGLQRFSDLASVDKLSEMFRALARTDEVSQAMNGVLQRMARTQGHAVGHGYQYKYTHKRGVRSLLRSATEWLHNHNLYLWRGGERPAVDRLNSPIALALPAMTAQQQRRLRNKHIYHVGDIIDDRAGYRQWAVPDREDWLTGLLPEDPPTDQGSILWPGQFWQPYADADGVRPADVVEILHVVDDTWVNIAIWKMSQRHNGRATYTRQTQTAVVKITNIFKGTHAERLDQSGLTGQKCGFRFPRLVPTPRATVTMAPEEPEWVVEARQFCVDQGPTYKPRIYTDGAYTEKDHDMLSVFDKDAVTKQSAAGLVIIHDGPDWRDRPIYALHISHGTDIGASSAYTMEFLALAVALRIQGTHLRATATCTDSMAVMKIIRNRRKHLGKADLSHRLLLQSIDNGIRAGAEMPRWVPSHAERRKKSSLTWSIDDWGNSIADKIAGDQPAALTDMHPDARWHTVSALDVLHTMPRAQELYFGDANGRPAALYGLMDHVHRIRMARYLTSRDAIRDGQPKWSDNTICMAASIYNGKQKSVGRYAHTARMIWDKHWHGRNRAKQHGLTAEDRRTTIRCHMCDGPDSQHHCFRWCTHSNVQAIRNETTMALQDYAQRRRLQHEDTGSVVERSQLHDLIRGVIDEYHNCADAGRVWTGNWNRSMVSRLQNASGTARINKKQCNALRRTLYDLYEIISQGANDIMDVRHGVREVQDAHVVRKAKPRPLLHGQRSIMDYLTGPRGLTGAEVQAQDTREAEIAALEAEMNRSIHSDDSIEVNEDWDDDMIEAVPRAWIPTLTDADNHMLDETLANALDGQQILHSVDSYSIRARSLRRVISGKEIDSSIVNGYMRLLQGRATARYIKCMGSSFFTRLYNPAGMTKHLPSDTVNLEYVSAYTKGTDIFQYQLIFIPVYVKSHWTLIAIDMIAEQIRYLDSQDGDGTQYLVAVKRWLAKQWASNPAYNVSPFPSDRWRTLPSHSNIIPQQQDHTSCGIFMLMFAELMASGQDVSNFTSDHCDMARRYIARSLLPGSVLAPTPTRLVHQSSPIRQARHSRRNPVERREGDMQTEFEAEDIINPVPSAAIDRVDAARSSRLDAATDMASLQPGGWLTDTVITQYFQYLRNRSIVNDTNCEFLSAQFFNRLYDPDRGYIRSHLLLHDDTARTAQGLTELDELRTMHDYDAIFRRNRVYIPVPQPQHWGLLEVDNMTRTITYMDSLRNGGSAITKVMRDYLVQYETECNVNPQLPPWRRRLSTGSPTSQQASMIQAPQQTNGNDCGVFTCAFADLLERGHDIMKAVPTKIPLARERLRNSLTDRLALHLIDVDDIHAPRTSSSQPVRVPVVLLPQSSAVIHHDLDEHPVGTVGELTADGPGAPVPGRRRSTRSNKYLASMADPDTPLDINHDRLTVRQSKDMGWCLFAKTGFSLSHDRVICTYHGKHIAAKLAKAKANKSKYIVELKGANGKSHYIDGFDADSQMCYSAGAYANDGINWTSRKDLWNAEFGVDDYNPNIFVLRPLRDILPGEQIYVWYGPRYWCTDDHAIEHMAMAVMTYGIDIETSTWAEDSYGNWRTLRKYKELRQLLHRHRYSPPDTVADPTQIHEVPQQLAQSLASAADEELDLTQLPIAPTKTKTKTKTTPSEMSKLTSGSIDDASQIREVFHHPAQPLEAALGLATEPTNSSSSLPTPQATTKMKTKTKATTKRKTKTTPRDQSTATVVRHDVTRSNNNPEALALETTAASHTSPSITIGSRSESGLDSTDAIMLEARGTRKRKINSGTICGQLVHGGAALQPLPNNSRLTIDDGQSDADDATPIILSSSYCIPTASTAEKAVDTSDDETSNGFMLQPAPLPRFRVGSNPKDRKRALSLIRIPIPTNDNERGVLSTPCPYELQHMRRHGLAPRSRQRDAYMHQNNPDELRRSLIRPGQQQRRHSPFRPPRARGHQSTLQSSQDDAALATVETPLEERQQMVMDIAAGRQVDDAVDYGRSSTEASPREAVVAPQPQPMEFNMIQETSRKRRRVADANISAPDATDISGDNGVPSTVDSLSVGLTDNVVLDASTSSIDLGLPKRTARMAGLQEPLAPGKRPRKE